VLKSHILFATTKDNFNKSYNKIHFKKGCYAVLNKHP